MTHSHTQTNNESDKNSVEKSCLMIYFNELVSFSHFMLYKLQIGREKECEIELTRVKKTKENSHNGELVKNQAQIRAI